MVGIRSHKGFWGKAFDLALPILLSVLLVFSRCKETRQEQPKHEHQIIAINTDSSMVLLVEVFRCKKHVLIYFRQEFHP